VLARSTASFSRPEVRMVHGRSGRSTVGQVIARFGQLADPDAEMDASQVAQVDQHYQHSVRHDLY
jgi:hypothetical protein